MSRQYSGGVSGPKASETIRPEDARSVAGAPTRRGESARRTDPAGRVARLPYPESTARGFRTMTSTCSPFSIVVSPGTTASPSASTIDRKMAEPCSPVRRAE